MDKNIPGYALLAVSIGVSAAILYWILAESPDEKVRRIFIHHDQLVLEEKRSEAKAVFEQALNEQGDGPLDILWLPFVRVSSNGYDQLAYYERILAGTPKRESTYSEIATLIDFAPAAFHADGQSQYLQALAKVPNVDVVLLQKYNLFPETGSTH